jgi:hypothetical protein
MRHVRSLPPAEVAIASILAPGLWALQTRSRRRAELHMKTASIKSTNRASCIGGTTRQEHPNLPSKIAVRDGGVPISRCSRHEVANKLTLPPNDMPCLCC